MGVPRSGALLLIETKGLAERARKSEAKYWTVEYMLGERLIDAGDHIIRKFVDRRKKSVSR
jgi:hypothetical protein